ncbi:trehalose-6-phosphate synthase [Embleya scabrispora]|uniref:trehalose-6-phosphate synthase n=1 Tax=Embleya scabrispora TaxID=159449 RepID=UPI00037E0CB1|nr:trehalose-6-phosphate synthase [Embleya scabrispora]MYS84791.1 HAD hydrolase family protein [Streptomyces sp. SID5474]
MRVLVTDLDGTLLGGTDAERLRLHGILSRHPEITVVFATGRGLASVRGVLADPLVPRPRWIVADVGASVADGRDLSTVTDVQSRLREGWPGAARVRDALSGFPGLTYQHGVAQDGRCSFHLSPQDLTGELVSAVAALGCSWAYSADRYLDVLPPGASKGAAVEALARAQGWVVADLLVAGDSLNDLSMFAIGAHGVVVGGAEPALDRAVAGDERVYRTEHHGAAGVVAGLRDLGWVEPEHALVVGYHRPPRVWTSTGWRAPTSPNGILPTLCAVLGTARGADHEADRHVPPLWVAGSVVDDDLPGPDGGEHDLRPALSLQRFDSAAWSAYFHRACKETLWPALMSQPERMRFDRAAWIEYRTVNRRFAEHIAERAAERATIWLHDYNLWLVPGLLRASRPDLRVGLFHHTPFPPVPVFDALPVAAEVRTSLTALDWAGFQTEGFAANFRATLGGNGSAPRVGVHPLGVDREAIDTMVRARGPHAPSAAGHLVLSVERLDYVKAPERKVAAVAALLAADPALHGRLRFRLVCPPPEPGITAYDSTRVALEQGIADVNERFGTATWRPVEYLPRNLSFVEVLDEYLAADVFWVTSLQDGMNLTAKEFVAAQSAAGGSGVLVLSRYAGAAEELGGGALLTDPRSPADLVRALRRALRMPRRERRARMIRLSTALGHEHPRHWAAGIIAAIEGDPDPGISPVEASVRPDHRRCLASRPGGCGPR